MSIETKVKERPILFSTPMVQAILEGKKTQTRRIVKTDANVIQWNPVVLNGYGGWCDEHGKPVKCRWEVGDILWVREKFIHLPAEYDYALSSTYPFNPAITYYAADEKEVGYGPWKPSIHMPKELCRIRLQITDIRVERLQSISEEDAKAEGAETYFNMRGLPGLVNDDKKRYKTGFAKIWEKINGEQSWKDNPFVWAITFKKQPTP